MNQKDLKIISQLRKDARMPLTKMSKNIHVPVSTIFDRLKAHEESIIQKNTCLLDFTKLGYNVRANMTLKVEREDKEGLKSFLIKHPSVNSVYKINNGFDFMIEGIFRQIKDLEEFVDYLESKFRIREKNTFFIIEDLKREEFLSDPELITPFNQTA